MSEPPPLLPPGGAWDPTPPAPAPEPPRSGLRPVPIIIAVVVVVVMISIALAQRKPDSHSTSTAPSTVEVTYKVSGSTRSASITMETPSGTSQNSSAGVPLLFEDRTPVTYTFRSGDFVYISAQNNEDSGTITCTIVGSVGQVISTVTSSGAYAIASCDGRAE